jgi:hypothetical protein
MERFVHLIYIAKLERYEHIEGMPIVDCGKCRCAPSSHHFRDAEKLDQIRKENQQLLTIQEPDFRKSNCYASTANIPDQKLQCFSTLDSLTE